jgi:cytoskeleton protein RodZ
LSETPSSPGLPGGGVRIVLRAKADSYVAVHTSDNQPLFSQLMRRGESYEVPSGADLILETGNAGGLQITVGGKRAPSLGPIGEIRRNIPLDGEKLLSGIN